jgi:[acyl-carrier-protein] S-malonyltransferase
MKKAFLFPGQGAQVVGMGLDLYQNSNLGRAIFDEADQILGFPISKLLFRRAVRGVDEDGELPAGNPNASVAAMIVLQTFRPDIKPDYVAGLSLGIFPL